MAEPRGSNLHPTLYGGIHETVDRPADARRQLAGRGMWRSRRKCRHDARAYFLRCRTVLGRIAVGRQLHEPGGEPELSPRTPGSSMGCYMALPGHSRFRCDNSGQYTGLIPVDLRPSIHNERGPNPVLQSFRDHPMHGPSKAVAILGLSLGIARHRGEPMLRRHQAAAIGPTLRGRSRSSGLGNRLIGAP
jgi:hypothetical protein